ncbi:MAG: hypothetical protein ACE5E7_09385 [Anaerolineae bacterium]
MNEDIRIRCAAVTKSGRQCKNYALTDSSYCRIHQRPEAGTNDRVQALVDELDVLVSQLKGTMPAGSASPYSPLTLLKALRDNLDVLAPEVQLGILQSFEGMTREDLLDIDTWKGLAYMMSYSARFQANQTREKMNERLPDPLKPDSVLRFMKGSFEKLAPDLAKDVMASFQGATVEDLMDPDTWKGVWVMLNYSLQFQAEQWKKKVANEE